MSREVLIKNIITHLRDVHMCLRQELQPLLEKSGLGVPHMHLLFVLSEHPDGFSVKEVADMTQVTPGAVSQIVDHMVQKDFVERIEDSDDRRVVRIALTANGREKVQNMAEYRRNCFTSIFHDLTDQELEQLTLLINKLNFKSERSSHV